MQKQGRGAKNNLAKCGIISRAMRHIFDNDTSAGRQANESRCESDVGIDATCVCCMF